MWLWCLGRRYQYALGGIMGLVEIEYKGLTYMVDRYELAEIVLDGLRKENRKKNRTKNRIELEKDDERQSVEAS